MPHSYSPFNRALFCTGSDGVEWLYVDSKGQSPGTPKIVIATAYVCMCLLMDFRVDVAVPWNSHHSMALGFFVGAGSCCDFCRQH